MSEEQSRQDRSYFFICSGNPSLVQACAGVLAAGAPNHDGQVGLYSATDERLQERAEEARQAAIPFDGQRHLGSAEDAMANVSDVLKALETDSIGDLHVAFIVVNASGAPWVREVHAAIDEDRASQGILTTFPVYVTEDAEAAKFVVESLTASG